MKKLHYLSLILAVLLLTYCKSSDLVSSFSQEDFDKAPVKVTNTTVTPTDGYSVPTGTTEVDVALQFTPDSGKNLTRIYITRNPFGTGAVPYQLENYNLSGKSERSVLKADGSIDVPSDGKAGVKWLLKLPVKKAGETATKGTVVFKIWATGGSFLGGKGDFRDPTNDNVIGGNAAVVTFKIGDGANDVSVLKEKTNITLGVPLADGSSKTFFSYLDCLAHRLDTGGEEIDFWDFGYYYVGGKGYFQSTKTYTLGTITALTLSGITEANAPLNTFYFAETSLSYDSVTETEIAGITIQANDENQKREITEGKTISFIDSYGKKGLIKIQSMVPGFGSTGQVTFSTKFQR